MDLNSPIIKSVAEAYLDMAEVTEEVTLSEAESGPAAHEVSPSDHEEYGKHMKKKFGVTTQYHGKTKLSFHGPMSSVRRALEYHYGSFDTAARNHKKVFTKDYLKKSL